MPGLPSPHIFLPGQRANLKVRHRSSPLSAILPGVRYVAMASLVVALVVGGGKFLTIPDLVEALEFTPHTVASGTSSIGVLGITTADLDNDGDNDIITAGLNGLRLYENKGKLSFTAKIIDEADAERVIVRKINDDSSLDLVVTLKGSSPSVKWYRNDGNLEFKGVSLGTTGSDAKAAVGDLNGDRSLDIVTAGSDGGSITLRHWMNNGSGTFTSTTLSTDAGASSVAIGDLDNNGYGDIITGGSKGLQRWKTTDGSTFNREDIDDSKQNRSHLVVADPGDGRTFIVTGDAVDNVVAIYRGTASESYRRVQLELSVDATTVLPIDLEGDGDLDVVAASQDDNTIFWYENTGNDNWSQRTLASNLQSVFGVAVGDLDKDGDNDVVAADHFRGNIFVYERIRVKPAASSPDTIQQSTAGSGKISFETTISDGDLDPTRLRVQYSLNGETWYKPWITAVKTSAGAVDLKNSNGYQIGTSNPIDTDANTDVTLTITWDTKSIQNTGGPLVGNHSAVQLRLIPRDNKNVGETTVSAKFQVDNAAPKGLGTLRVTQLQSESAQLAWSKASDNSGITYEVFYGTDQTAVLEQRSDSWDSGDDAKLADVESVGTTITGLQKNTTYTFKLVATDDFGNSAAAPSVQGTTTAVDTEAPDASPTSPPSESSPAPTLSATPTPGSLPPTPTRRASPSPVSKVPSVLQGNKAPLADAGPDHVVNPLALVILDGGASTDNDLQDRIAHYQWRQIAGPRVDMRSASTATPSFAAGGENETYIFLLTVRDVRGAIGTDTVTVVTRSLPDTHQTPVVVNTTLVAPPPATPPLDSAPPLVRNILHPLNLILFATSVLSTLLLLSERVIHAVRQGKPASRAVTSVPTQGREPKGKVVHYKTGKPIAGAQVLIYGQDGKLRATERTNTQGVFPTFFPVGQYTLGVQAEGFAFAPAASRALAPEGGILYTGGNLVVRDANQALAIIIPLKPVAAEVSSHRVRFLHFWQALQHLGRVLSWPIFLLGALLNTVLVFMVPRPLYLVIEVAYIILVILKIALEVRVRPAYGQVRDAITHVPLDLAVVRLFEQGANRLVMTRVTNNQGKFFALPPSGLYTVTISKPGYATFSKEDVEIKSEHDTTLQMTADLMPVAPHTTGLQQARAAVL